MCKSYANMDWHISITDLKNILSTLWYSNLLRTYWEVCEYDQDHGNHRLLYKLSNTSLQKNCFLLSQKYRETYRSSK